jgi:hypothetical protein
VTAPPFRLDPRRVGLGLMLASGPVAWAVFQVSALRPGLVETVYARRLYPWTEALLELTGLRRMPYAAGELLGLALGAAGLASLGWWCLGGFRGFREAARRGVVVLLASACAASVLYTAFVGAWALNYRRPPLAERLGWPTARPGVAELHELCAELVPRVEAARAGAVLDPDPQRVASRAAEAYGRLGAALAPALPAMATAPVKPAILSPMMSRSLTYGMVIPWTHEALINRDTPLPAIPFTVCHEMAHQRGIAREDEANFVGYLAARLHPDPDFRYSALRFALGEVLGQLARVDPKASGDLVAALSPAVRADYRLESEWARRHRSAFSRVQAKAYDGYLKSQGQSDGLKSYGRVVDLLIAERRLKQAGKLPEPLR